MNNSIELSSKKHRILKPPITEYSDEQYTCICAHHYNDALLTCTDRGNVYFFDLTDFSCQLWTTLDGLVKCCDVASLHDSMKSSSDCVGWTAVFGAEDGRVFSLHSNTVLQRPLHKSRVLTVSVVNNSSIEGASVLCSVSEEEALIVLCDLTVLHRLCLSAICTSLVQIQLIASPVVRLIAVFSNCMVLEWDPVTAADINATARQLYNQSDEGRHTCNAACVCADGGIYLCCGDSLICVKAGASCDAALRRISSTDCRVDFCRVKCLRLCADGVLAALLADNSALLFDADSAGRILAPVVYHRRHDAVLDVAASRQQLIALLSDGTVCLHRRTVQLAPDCPSSRQVALIDGLVLERHRMALLLRHGGKWPGRHRALIWRRLLRLPADAAGYSATARRGEHAAVRSQQQRFPVTDGSLWRYLRTTLSALYWWNPSLTKAPWLPLFVFPFCRLFAAGLVSGGAVMCCETLMSVLSSWCSDWMLLSPHPPLRILAIAENTMAHQCPRVLAHLMSLSVTARHYVWPLLETAFSEVLDDHCDWLQLWDHVLANSCEYIVAAAVAFSVLNQRHILAFTRRQDIVQFYHSDSGVNVRQLIQCSYTVLESTPSCLLRDVYKPQCQRRPRPVAWQRPAVFHMFKTGDQR